MAIELANGKAMSMTSEQILNDVNRRTGDAELRGLALSALRAEDAARSDRAKMSIAQRLWFEAARRAETRGHSLDTIIYFEREALRSPSRILRGV
jgi:hypothetical protein